MPTIYDNIETKLLSHLRERLHEATHADFCVGYFNLRGWKSLADAVDAWHGGPNACCRLLIGMQRPPEEDVRALFSLQGSDDPIDNQTAILLRRRIVEEFRRQLVVGAPSNADEAALRRLRKQLKAGKVVVKLFLEHPLHAKLYLVHRTDPVTPIVGYVGSSNLTFAGLQKQGELNVDVVERDATGKLQQWFDDRWHNRWCLDISDDLAKIINQSWAGDELVSPYHVYLKIAYHLSRDARAGLTEFSIPPDIGNTLFDFQTAAVQIAAHHLDKRGGVVIGDVVGLGKTLMATALARVFQNDLGSTLIICPKNLVPMWEDYRDRYSLAARVVSLTNVQNELPDLYRFRLILIDESHNLRNAEGKRYRIIQDYIRRNDSKCILLSATPYNKAYLDLSSQLRLFVNPDADIGVRPERLLKQLGETEFLRRHQCGVRTLAAFEKSEEPDDWRDLLRRFLVRRTRSFIQTNYAHTDEHGRTYLELAEGKRFSFPVRVPKTVPFHIDERNPDDQYARLFASSVETTVNQLGLPRYGLGNYKAARPAQRPTADEQRQIDALSRAGKRLMGFCRTNLFKRLESGGPAFIQSVERHVLRNFVYLHAIERDLPLPIGPQESALLDVALTDEDADRLIATFDDGGEENGNDDGVPAHERTETGYRRDAEAVYNQFAGSYKRRFKWLRPSLFDGALAKDLLADARALIGVLDACGRWNPATDAKLNALEALLRTTHPTEKVLVFTQFADTVAYLTEQLKARGLTGVEGVTGASADPTALAWRFSPVSNGKEDVARQAGELRVLIATDVLSEGQNLQDCAVVVNLDLPWAIIRLIQRAGRVDRIGQTAPEIRCYSFLPAEGIERIIRLRTRVRTRLQLNAEVVGADERFFEDDGEDQPIYDLYHEKADILDGDGEDDVDLVSNAFQIWKNATDNDPTLKKVIEDLPDVVYATRAHTPAPNLPEGVLVYVRTAEDNDALAWIDADGHIVSESQQDILDAAACEPDTPARPRLPDHHTLVAGGVKQIAEEERQVGGQLGRPTSPRFRAYERLKKYADELGRATTPRMFLVELDALRRVAQAIYQYPLQSEAASTLNRLLRSGAPDDDLARRAIELRDHDRLSVIHDADNHREPQIICSLGLFSPDTLRHAEDRHP
ncbi:MAG: helicase-related protein [Thermomicrobiales bacterium]